MNGRLGNQLFQYAFARKIYSLGNYKILIDFTNVIKTGEKLGEPNKFVDELKNFNCMEYETKNKNGYLIKKYGTKKQKLLIKIYFTIRKLNRFILKRNLLNKYQLLMQKNGIYKEDETNITLFGKYKSNVFIKGYFENPMFFDDIKNQLQKEFVPKYPVLKHNLDLYKIITKKESVCVSFRSWNELKNVNIDEYNNRNVCTKEYYEKAMQKMQALHPNSIFIIFSDDIDFVKRHFSFTYPVIFEHGDDPVYEKLRLMYSCKHFIMSTSTFSWWSQYLCKNDNKTVISPNKWFSNGKDSKLLLKDWIKIEV